ncbi:acyltransferase family protein, partial [Aggregatibacter kilianii]|uniref:acyltransferase family protein n=1 Tax=Aggregatibacter kilianii TaxID=2025884 RepID=UPI0028E264F8
LTCLYFYHKNLIFIPGLSLVLPCLLAALVIYTTTQESIVKKLLSTRPMVFIGKISYSLYLYHWIFISFAYYITGTKQIDNQIVSLVIVLTILFSILSYYFIEQPIRKSKLNFKQAFIYLYVIPSVLVIAYNMYERKQIRNEKEKIEQEVPLADANSQIPAKILTIGDSHAGHLTHFLDYVGKQEGWKTDILNTGPECQVLVNTNGDVTPECQAQWDEIAKYNAVFISEFYDLRMGGQPVPRFEAESYLVPDFEIRFRKMVEKLAALKPVYVFANNSSLNRSPIRGHILAKYGLDKYLEPIRRMGDIDSSNQIVRDLIKDIPNVYWVDAQQYLPKDSVMAEGKYLYGDQDHLTNFGSHYMGREFNKNQRLLTPEQVEKLYK